VITALYGDLGRLQLLLPEIIHSFILMNVEQFRDPSTRAGAGTFLSLKLTFLSLKLTFLSLKLTFLSPRQRGGGGGAGVAGGFW
jgi:hypothetical protein